LQRSIATTPAATSAAESAGARFAARAGTTERTFDPTWIGFAFVVAALAVYILSNPSRGNFYNHFVWQADAFDHLRAWIPFPYRDADFDNSYFQDVLPKGDGTALLPFPPLPAILLMPFVKIWGLATNAALLCAILGAINVGFAWRLTTRLTDKVEVAVLATAFYGFGTVAWYAAMLGSTWFFAHVVASAFLLLAITRSIDAERDEALRRALGVVTAPPPTVRSVLGAVRAGPAATWRAFLGFLDGAQFKAGLLFGLAGLSRLTVMFGAPFFVVVGGGGSFARRAVSAGAGAAVPIAMLIGYNFLTTGHPTLTHPAYDFLYKSEYTPREEFRHLDWGIEDPRYLPQNGGIMLAWPPRIAPNLRDPGTPCAANLLDPMNAACPIAAPDPIGMSLLLTSPAYLLIAPLLVAAWRRRIVLGSVLAVGSIALVNVMHFSQGWVQFGYRFSNDFAPFALVMVTIAIARIGLRRTTWALVLSSIAVNAWGVYWGVKLGW
jgi:hypothetical protein